MSAQVRRWREGLWRGPLRERHTGSPGERLRLHADGSALSEKWEGGVSSLTLLGILHTLYKAHRLHCFILRRQSF